MNKVKFIIIPSLQGTLAKRTKLMLQSNFAKEPFRPSHVNDGLKDITNMIYKQNENKNRQCLTACIVHLAGRTKILALSHLLNFSVGLIDKCFEAPNDTIHTNR